MYSSKNPLVSIIITTYNRPDMLSRAINSAINQSYKNVEVIVVDDNNPDSEARIETENLMQNYNKLSNFKYIKHPKNMNGAAARNTGINKSAGEIISFLDDDDWYLYNKIEKQVSYLLKHPEYDAVYCGWRRNNKDIIPTKEGDLTFEVLSGDSIIITNTIMMKKDAAIKSGGWDERFRRNQEAAFLLRYFKSGYKIGVIPEKLVEFDMSDRSNAANPRENEKYINFFLEKYQDQILKCSEKVPNAKKIIYAKRYKAVFLNYLKHKDYKRGIKFYLRTVKWIPIKLNLELLKYIRDRLKK